MTATGSISRLTLAGSLAAAFTAAAASFAIAAPVLLTSACEGGSARVGSDAADVIRGSAARDRLVGLGAGDRLYGGAGRDCVDGGSGADVVAGGPGADRLIGGAGDDLVRANDGEADRVECGEGFDAVVADSKDTLAGCESVTRQTDVLRSGSYDYSVTFRNTYGAPIVAKSDDGAIICAHSVDHPTIPAGAPDKPSVLRTAFQVQEGIDCGWRPTVVKWILLDGDAEAGYVSVSVARGSGTVSCQPLGVPCSVDGSQQLLIG